MLPMNFGLSKGMGSATSYEPMKHHMTYIRFNYNY